MFKEWFDKEGGYDGSFDTYESAAEAAWDHQQTEIDRLKQECEQLRADLYKALDYIHEGEDND